MKKLTFVILIGLTLAITLFYVEKATAFTNAEEFLIYAYGNEVLKNQDIDIITRGLIFTGTAIGKEIYDNAKGGKQGTFNWKQVSIRISGVIVAEGVDAVLSYISTNFIERKFIDEEV